MAENLKKRLDITAVVGATRLQESFRLVVNLRCCMDLLVCSKAGILTMGFCFYLTSTVSEKMCLVRCSPRR